MTDTVATDTSTTADARAGGPGGDRRPGPPIIPGPLEVATSAWRWLRRMSTALLLLFALAIASVVGTVVPQEPVSPNTVADWRAGTAGPGEAVARVLDAVTAFDLFGSWWFLGITALLFTSLTACLIPRVRAFVRTARRQPPAGRGLDRLRRTQVVASPLDPAAAATAAAAQLRRRRYRVRMVDTTSVAAERGHWREGGSLVFHLAFYVLLVGVVIGNAFGFTGQVNLAEGDPGVVDTRLSYGSATPGRFFGLGDHRGFTFALDDFDVAWHADDTPASYASDLTITDADGTVERTTVRVNEPVRHDGMTLYQIRWGMAPLLRVTSGDRLVKAERVTMSQGPDGVWTGVIALSTTAGNQIALDLALVPDADIAVGRDGSARVVTASPRADNPRIFADLYAGELGLERPVPLAQMDRSGGAAVQSLQLAPGEPVDVLDGLTVELVDVGEWSGFQVSHQPGRWILVIGAIASLVGLLGSLYAYRRRVWVEVTPDGDGSQVRVAGVALQRPERFDEEYVEIVADIRGDVDGAARSQAAAASSA